jgi:nucleotide-binding universal stress UspA family protein
MLAVGAVLDLTQINVDRPVGSLEIDNEPRTGRRIVTYATVMVHLQLGRSNAHLLQIAGDLAERFGAGVIGIATCQPMQIVYEDAYVPANLIEQDRQEIEKELAAAQSEFRAALQGRVSRLEWRSKVTVYSLSRYLASQARSADLVVTGVDRDLSLFDTTRHADLGDLVLQAGRPVLVVPTMAAGARFDRVLVGWKDAREARLAVVNALPFLSTAARVTVVEIAGEEALAETRTDLADVVGWLKHHGVEAEPMAVVSEGDDARQLNAIAENQAADLIVAGAYGHSRLREWVLGGVTRDLLVRASRCSLVSH